MTHCGYDPTQAHEKEFKKRDVPCTSLDEVRQRIDAIDQSLVSLLAQRGKRVTQAASFKKSTDDLRAPARVEQVIERCVDCPMRQELRQRLWNRSTGP